MFSIILCPAAASGAESRTGSGLESELDQERDGDGRGPSDRHSVLRSVRLRAGKGRVVRIR